MTVRTILRMGDPRLREVARPVTAFGTDELRALVSDMLDTMAAARGAGLAAPQIGIPLRVVVFGFDRSERYPQAPPVPRTVLVNPVVEPRGPETEEGWEGCLSVPGLRGRVRRHARVRYSGYDPDGSPIRREAEGFHARVVQHECDHLDGVLYPQRMDDLTSLGFIEELEAAGVFDPQPCDD